MACGKLLFSALQPCVQGQRRRRRGSFGGVIRRKMEERLQQLISWTMSGFSVAFKILETSSKKFFFFCSIIEWQWSAVSHSVNPENQKDFFCTQTKHLGLSQNKIIQRAFDCQHSSASLFWSLTFCSDLDHRRCCRCFVLFSCSVVQNQGNNLVVFFFPSL